MHYRKQGAHMDCPQTKRFDQIHNVQLHVNEFKKVYRAEISQLGISLTLKRHVLVQFLLVFIVLLFAIRLG